MSGRDLRAFLSSHRSGTFHTSKNADQQQRYGASSARAPKITHVDYDQLLSDVKKHKEQSKTGLQRFKRLSRKGKEAKESSLLKKHQEIWMKEKTKLVDLKSRAQSELNQWRLEVMSQGDPCLNELLTQLTLCESELYEQRQQFEELSLTPLWSLRADLKSLLEDRSFPEADQTVPSCLDQIRDELEHVKEQQREIQRLMQEEFVMVEDEVERFIDDWGFGNHNNTLVVKETNSVPKGVPPELGCLECPDEKLRNDSLSEFLRLDEQYGTLLEKWQAANQQVIDVPYGGWCRDEAEHFSHLLEQYPPSLANRRRLYLDRALREFPDKSRVDVVAHESWHFSLQHYLSVRQNLLSSWAQNKQELGSKIASLFEEAKRIGEAKEVARAGRKEWREKCQRLYGRVQAWREEKVKVQQLKAEEAARQQALDEERRRADELIRQQQREEEKQQIRQYHTHLQSCRQSELEQVRRAEEAAKIERKKQAVRNVERIGYRRERQSEKMAEAREVREMAAREEIEREKRLELLRQQVQVDVTFDPERVRQETVASQARVTAQTEPEFTLQQPLYKMYSYPADKITSDPRVRLEAALREAGLHDTTYARKVLSRIPPPQKPRPDQSSSLFRD